VDAHHGITAADETVAEILRRTNKPIVVAANKADTLKVEVDAFEFYALGLGEVFAISAIHGAGVGDMLDAVTSFIKEIPDLEDDEADQHLKIAIIGRPNAGKSTLLNKLIGEERVITSPIAGTTRDAIDTDIMWHGEKVTLIDTAGIRRRGRIEPGVEQFSVIRAFNAIERADVAILVIDGVDGVTEQDEHIAGYILEEYKSIVVVINKWDIVDKSNATINDFMDTVRDRLHFLPYVPVIFISALTGQRIHEVMETAHRVYENRFIRIPTSEFNDLLREALEKHAPPTSGTRRLKIFYGSQVRIEPPLFLLHVNNAELMHFSYERYLENSIRAKYPFEGTPIRISIRERKREEEA